MTTLRNRVRFRYSNTIVNLNIGTEIIRWERVHLEIIGMKTYFWELRENPKLYFFGKIVADWVCRLRGCLVWADTLTLRFGIDVFSLHEKL